MEKGNFNVFTDLVDAGFMETINFNQTVKNIVIVPVYLDKSKAIHQMRFNIESILHVATK